MANESAENYFNTSRARADDIPTPDCIRGINGTPLRYAQARRAMSVKLSRGAPALVPDGGSAPPPHDRKIQMRLALPAPQRHMRNTSGISG